jgi:hypothetical protein
MKFVGSARFEVLAGALLKIQVFREFDAALVGEVSSNTISQPRKHESGNIL